MTAGRKRMCYLNLYCLLLIGVKGHAGMCPHRNFGRGGRPKKGPHKNKNNTIT